MIHKARTDQRLATNACGNVKVASPACPKNPRQSCYATRRLAFVCCWFFSITHLDAEREQLWVQKAECESEEAEGALQRPSSEAPSIQAQTPGCYVDSLFRLIYSILQPGRPTMISAGAGGTAIASSSYTSFALLPVGGASSIWN